MSGSKTVRSLLAAAGLAAALVSAASCGGDRRVPQVDTSAGGVGVIDSAPAAVATTVAAVVTDENVFALLDTAFAALIATDRLAQSKTTAGPVNRFAAKAVSENAVTRSGIKSTADRLNIAPVLPDRDVIRDQAQAMRDLESRAGADFNRAYLDRAIEARKQLIDEIDDALESGGVRQEPVRKFLSEVRVSLDAGRKTAEDLRAKQG